MPTASKSLGTDVEKFLTSVSVTTPMPKGFGVLDPYKNAEVRAVLKQFCRTYYAGKNKRIGMWGINPGRFGAGTTGLPFTDPPRLESLLGITSSIEGRGELSAEFVSKVIEAYGGPNEFYRDIYLTGFSPLGFIKDDKNINFYDDRQFLADITPEIIAWVKHQQTFAVHQDRCIVLGKGKLQTFVKKHIEPAIGFGNIVYLEHPRFIMQYRRSKVDEYIAKYVEVIRGLKQ